MDDFDTQLQAEDVYTNHYTYVTDEDYTRDGNGCAWNKKGQFVYFSRPVQLRFYDKDNDRWVGGIGFQDYIICGCCGASIWLPDFYEDFAETDDPIQVFSNENWHDLSDAIIG